MPNTYTEVGHGGLGTLGLSNQTLDEYVAPCARQTATTMCCNRTGHVESATWKFMNKAWVAAITVCTQAL